MNPVVKRTITALAVAAFVVCSLLYLPLAAVLPVMLLLVLLVQLEFVQLMAKKYETMPAVGILAALAYLLGIVYFGVPVGQLVVPIVFAMALFALFGKSANPMQKFATTLLAFVYIPVMLLHFIKIPQIHGMQMLLYIIAIIKVSDMGGFAFGKAFGRHKMCPKISPKKSWEGFAGSLFASCLVSSAFIPLTGFCWCKAIAFGIAAATVGTLGDLVESRFKREVDVKDSATFMPAGMGGFLDMFDSLVFAPAILFYFI